jgi:hypothetical protein
VRVCSRSSGCSRSSQGPSVKLLKCRQKFPLSWELSPKRSGRCRREFVEPRDQLGKYLKTRKADKQAQEAGCRDIPSFAVQETASRKPWGASFAVGLRGDAEHPKERQVDRVDASCCKDRIVGAWQ